MGKMSKHKGARGEREFAKYLFDGLMIDSFLACALHLKSGTAKRLLITS